jgi:rod shape-determining protein MreB
MVKISRNSGIEINIGNKESKIIVNTSSGIIYSQTLPIGSDTMNESIMQYVKHKYKLRIGNLTAEEIKKELGSALLPETGRTMEIRARQVFNDELETIYITDEDIYHALDNAVREITASVLEAVKSIPKETVASIINEGINLNGNTAGLKHIDKYLMNATGISLKPPVPSSRNVRHRYSNNFPA